MNDKQHKEFEEKIVDKTSSRSFIMPTEGILREVTRGIINEKWLICFKNSNEKRLICMILDEYLNNIYDKIWIECCNKTIALEKQLGIFRDMKRKKNMFKEDDDSTKNTKTKKE
ncbi:hypothetical protein C1646_767078 [Rhizophagus diaphanus]|nr:hypothetical protein C1646_767078 [Rhizophagus diaphanus] [Rhizophagus sp. MUCL 43196]